MDQLVIDISDIMEELGILFANLIEDFPINEYIHSPNFIQNERQDSIISSTEIGLHLSETIHHVSGDAQPGEHRSSIFTTTKSPAIWMGYNTNTHHGWGPGPIGQQYHQQGRLQITGSRSFHGQCWCYLCAGSIPSVQEFCRLEPFTRTLLSHSNTDHRSGWLLRSQPVQRSTSFST